MLEHLVGTAEVMRRWDQPIVLQHAALLHSVYGTDTYRHQLLEPSRRDDVRAIAGTTAERLAYLFSVTPRGPLLAGTHRWSRELPTRGPGAAGAAVAEPPAEADELDALLLLHMANLADQGQARDGSPGQWLVRLADLAQLLRADGACPGFVSRLAGCSKTDESQAIRAYRVALASASDPAAMADQMALAAVMCPAVAEPCAWLAHLSLIRGDLSAGRDWAERARQRLLDLGTPWDKRLTFDEWLSLIEHLATAAGPAASEVARHPRALHRAVMATGDPGSSPHGPTLVNGPARPPKADEGRRRFDRYLDTFIDDHGPIVGGVYPDLDSRPWFDPAAFPVVAYLEAHAHAIRDELRGLDSRFQRESERLERIGDWDVVFLYERGRRHDDVCDACPVTTRGIETHATMRTVAGLIYVSRMRPGTHIAAHRGPTNLRVRCHLGITVPEGDCAIRVGDRTERWHEGRCLVFDDHFEHEAWNHTEQDRIVLIVDLWHPGLSATEVDLLDGLHRYAYRSARQLNRYWSANARAAGDGAPKRA